MNASRWCVKYDRGDKAYYMSGAPGDEYSFVPVSFEDFDLQVEMRSGEDLSQVSSATMVVVFGYQNSQNYYYLKLCQYAPENKLYRIRNGNTVLLASANQTTLDDNNYHVICISRQGGQTKVYFDGYLLMNDYDSNFLSGKIALGAYKSKVYIDNVAINCSSTEVTEKLSDSSVQKKLSIYPNPFNSQITVKFYVSQPQKVSLRIYNLLGRQIAEIFSGQISGGWQEFVWQTEKDLPSGIYFLQLQTSQKTETQKIILQK